MADVGVVGSILMDVAVFTPRLPRRGENMLAYRMRVGPGGKGANAAVAVTRIGGRALLVGCVGDDQFGCDALTALRAEGVVVEGVTVDGQAQTGVAVILVDDEGENTILVVIGANERLTPEHVDVALRAHWSALDALIADFEVPAEAVAAAVEGAALCGIPVIVDAGPPRRYGPEIWGRSTILSPNRWELAELVGRPLKDMDDIQVAALDILAAGPRAVVLKLGADGALLLTREETVHVPAFRVATVDTTGAGDAFTGALAVAVAEGQPLEAAVRFANAAGALATTRRGTMDAVPSRVDIEQLLAEQLRGESAR